MIQGQRSLRGIGLAGFLSGIIVIVEKLPEGERRAGELFVNLIVANQGGDFIDFFHVSLGKQTTGEHEDSQPEGDYGFHRAKIEQER